MILEAWHWGVFGLGLLALEMLVSGFVLLWFGLAALTVGLVMLFVPLPLPFQWGLWGILAVGSAFVWYVMRRIPASQEETTLNRRGDQYLGQVFVLTDPIVDHRGTLKIGDSVWRVEARADLPKGTSVRVSAMLGTALHVEEVQTTQE